MLFIVVFGVLIAFSYDPSESPQPLGATGWRVLATLCTVLALWLLAEVFARLTVHRLRMQRTGALRSYQRLRWVHTAALLVSYAAVVHGLHWPAVIWKAWGLEHWVLIDDVLVFAPFLVALVLGWLANF